MTNLIVVTTFASNVTRLECIFTAAQKAKRKVFMLGRSLWRIFTAAQEAGYLQGVEICNEKNIKNLKKHEILVICTGCQGEDLAALGKIASGSHPHIRIAKNDLIIFSSKVIPGNEKKIYKMYNQLTKAGIKILHEHNEFVHVSGHPSRKEVQQMYDYIKPQIAIPVHGESFHLFEHCRVAKELKIPHVINVSNGDVVSLNQHDPNIFAGVENGRYAVDGCVLLEDDNKVFSQRKVMMNNGIFIVNIILNSARSIQIDIDSPGLLDKKEDDDLLQELYKDIKKFVYEYIDRDKQLKNNLKKLLRKRIRKELNKSPMIFIHLHKY